MMKDYLVKALACNEHVRIYICSSTHMAEEARKRFDLWPTSAATLGLSLIHIWLVKVFMDKYEEMQKDDELWSTAMAIQMGEARYRYGLEDSFEEGMKEGIIKGKAEGKLEGERQLLHRLMEAKFQEDCTAWLQSLTEDQLHIVSNLLLECDTLESVKKQLNRRNTI